ncbi:MAG: asparagine synthase (glutamine-hydrolyzing) [Clostridiales bacterium]|jgi:asparagine synthase (glutamine-hydrolysing)|nr:asparagine synthase (glutamine-hydrolyzing) [Clostridiales bacterium]
MSGISGIVSFNKNVSKQEENVKKMVEKNSHRGKKGIKILSKEHVVLGVANFYSGDELQPISYYVGQNEFIIAFSGEIYNFSLLKSDLENRGHKIVTELPQEIVLKSFVQWGPGCLTRFNGIYAFAIWNKDEKELFLARDRFGIIPVYYTFLNDLFVFSSEIKGLFAHPKINAELDLDGISEVIGLGPAHTPGSGVFKDIYEIKPAHFATYNNNGFNERKYWELENKKHEDDLDTTIEKVKKLTTDAINRQLNAQELCCFLSGGIDSSTIVALAAHKFEKSLNTFSLEYEGNDKYFSQNEFQPDSDEEFIKLVSEKFDTKHEIITVTNKELVDLLDEATYARDLPGMGDIDSSLLYFCKKVAEKFNISVSGECGDEVFGGYPWFHKKEDLENDIFPWAKNLQFRHDFISPEILKRVDITKYIKDKYKNSIDSMNKFSLDTQEEARRREFAALNLEWFMYSLGERSERIGMSQTLEIRMPYCDYELVEYVWNVPWEFKAYKNREKGLLRKAMEDLLPEKVAWRKKSPYPKTHNPEFESLVKNKVNEIISDSKSQVLKLINKDFVVDTMKAVSDYGKPWFGQLMATPQLYSYIIQLDAWFKHYDVKLV